MIADVVRQMALAWCFGLVHGDARARSVARFWQDAFERSPEAAAIAWLVAIGRRA